MKAIKAIAVSQVVFLLIAIIVLAIAAFLLYSAWKGGGSTIDRERCRSMAIAECNKCKAQGSLGACGIPDWGTLCKDANGACNWDTSISPCDSSQQINCANLGF
jgi:hypothetical protein